MPANCETCPFVNTNSILFYCRANVNDVKVYSMDNVGKRQADCPLVLVDEDNDLILRQKALKTILEQPPEVHYPSWSAGQIRSLPSAQFATDTNVGTKLSTNLAEVGTETISRQAVMLRVREFIGNPSYTEKMLVDELNGLPPVQPEIICCKDCKYWDTSWQNDYAPDYHYCPMIDGTRRSDFYCADAERKVTE